MKSRTHASLIPATHGRRAAVRAASLEALRVRAAVRLGSALLALSLLALGLVQLAARV
ncbi:MAG: hypothetical protein QM617_09515 [Comamonas sp.]